MKIGKRGHWELQGKQNVFQGGRVRKVKEQRCQFKINEGKELMRWR